ncbi:craniofacial development protein 2-like [Aplysia californica]|uniref:Craniofacial development protein 2-like n=1 Tax=Aplysia californica TaxID=6500 RepID=A0ABM0JLV6_APLCA|nr:craniofacial development protein 2-like [Aplysia californica]
MTNSSDTIPDRLSPGSPRTAPSAVVHQNGGEKYTTDAQKIRARNNISIGTWNVRTLRTAGKLEELTYEMNRYQWAVLGLCEVWWKKFGEITKQEGHKLYFNGEEDTHMNGVGVFIHKDIVNTVMGCRPISSRLITIRFRAVPFNITIIQAYAPTSDYDEQAVEGFYDQIQEVIDQTPKKYIIVVQGDWNAKVEKDVYKNWKETCGQHCNSESNERGLRLLEFASYNNLVLTNTFGQLKASRRWTWHRPSGEHHNQIDYIMVKKRFQSSVKIGKTRTFPGADVGIDHDLVMMNFHPHLKRIKKHGNTRVKFDLEKLKNPEVAEASKP